MFKFPVADKDLEKYLRKLIGRRVIKDALRRLDILTQELAQEEARMMAEHVMRVVHNVEQRVESVNDLVVRFNDMALEGAFIVLATHTCHRKPLYD